MNPAREIPATDDAVEAALDAESARGNREFATYRLAGLTVFLALMAAFRLFIPGWIGPLPAIAVYWVVSGVVWVYSRRSDAAARATSLAVPLLDMPALTLVLLRTMWLLREAGHPAHAQGIRLAGAAFCLVFVVGTLPGLSVSHVYLATATAVVCEALLILSYEPDFTLAAVMSTTIGMVGLIAASVTRRTRSLVRNTAADEVRRRRLQRYFPAQVVEHVEGATDRLSAGESREVSVLFCDIRGFTRLSEPLPSESVVELLNDFHGCMADVIFEHGGTLDKFMGDGLMSYFGAPVAQPDHALRALRCAIAMQSRLDTLNRDREVAGKPPLSMGVGIHSGRVVLGDIGSAQRRDFTIVGDAVNVASKIERLTRTLDRPVLISSETRRLIDDSIELVQTDPVAIPGRSGKLVCYYPG